MSVIVSECGGRENYIWMRHPSSNAQASIKNTTSPVNAATATGSLLEAAPVKATGEEEGRKGVALGADLLGVEVLPTASG